MLCQQEIIAQHCQNPPLEIGAKPPGPDIDELRMLSLVGNFFCFNDVLGLMLKPGGELFMFKQH